MKAKRAERAEPRTTHQFFESEARRNLRTTLLKTGLPVFEFMGREDGTPHEHEHRCDNARTIALRRIGSLEVGNFN